MADVVATPDPTLADVYKPEESPGIGNETTTKFYAERKNFLDESITPPERKVDPYGLEQTYLALSTTPKNVAETSLAISAAEATRPLKETYIADIALGLSDITPEDTAVALGSAAALHDLENAAQYVPKDATSEATTWQLAPDLETAAREAFAQQDIAAGIVSARLEAKSGWDFAIDLGASMIIPFRSTYAQYMATDYYGTLKSWKAMNTRERYSKFPIIENDIWKASNGNSVIYQTLIAPFINPADEIWPKLDIGLEATQVGATIFGIARTAKVLKGINKPMKFRDLALRMGNKPAAGASTVKSMAAGDTEAVVEGLGIKIPEGDEHFPQLVNGLSGPTQSVMIEQAIKDGTAGPNQTRLGIKLSYLNDEEKAAAIARETSRLIVDGDVTKVGEDEAGFTLRLARPSTENVTASELVARQKNFWTTMEAKKEELRALIADTKEGEKLDEKAALTSEIRYLRLQKREVDNALASLKGYKGAGKITSVKLPTTAVEDYTFNWSVDDKGMLDFHEASINAFSHLLLSKESTLDKVEQGLTSLGTIVDMQQRKVFADLQRMYRDVQTYLKQPLHTLPFGNRSSKTRVNAVLMRGDAQQVRYTETELLRGVDTDIGRIRLTDNEIEAYMGMRLIYDELWHWLNTMRRDERVLNGQSAFIVKYVDKSAVTHDVPVFAKARTEDISHVVPEINKRKAANVIEAHTGLPVELSKVPRLEQRLANRELGFVELTEPFHTADGHQYRHLLVDVNVTGDVKQARQAKPIPDVVLPYRKGYVPKLVADPVFNVVSIPEDMVVNGIKVREERVARGFVSNHEAHAFVKQADIAAAKKGVPVEELPSRTWRVEALGRDYSARKGQKLDFLTDQLFKGAFAGNRTDGVFKIGLEGREAQRMSAFESIQRYNDYVARMMPMHTFKQSMIKSFLNSARNGATSMLETEGDWTSKLKRDVDPKKYRAAKAMQDWMKATFAVPSSDENLFQKATHTIANMLDAVIFKDDIGTLRAGASLSKRIQKGLLSSRWAADPFQAAKGLVFDMYLGMFNPIQLMVQSAGMMMPFLLHPVESAANLPKFSVLRTLYGMRSAEDAAKVAKAMGLNGQEFKTLWNAYRRSGVADSIIAHSDFGHFVHSNRGYHTPGLWEDFKKSGRIFYNIGELNNRTFSWTVAYDRLMKQGKIPRTGLLTDEQVNMVTKEGLRLGMNLTQANRARYQTGILGVTTQFWKVTTQFWENALSGLFSIKKGNAWTFKESAAAMFGTLLMFGAAGYSVDELWSGYEGWLIDTFNLDPSKPEDAQIIAGARGGFTEMIGLKAFGYTPDLADRIGVASGINLIWENFIDPAARLMISGEDPEFLKMLLGASYGINTRAHKAFGDVMSILMVTGDDNVMPKEQALSVLASLGDIASSFSNVHQAMLWREANNIIVKNTGETLGMEPGNTALIAKALGIEPLALEKYYIIDRKSKEYAKIKSDTAKQVTTLLRQSLLTQRYMNPSERALLNAQINFLLKGLEGKDREDVYTAAMKSLDADPKTGKLILQMIDGIINAQEQQDVAQEKANDLRILEGLNAGK